MMTTQQTASRTRTEMPELRVVQKLQLAAWRIGRTSRRRLWMIRLLLGFLAILGWLALISARPQISGLLIFSLFFAIGTGYLVRATRQRDWFCGGLAAVICVVAAEAILFLLRVGL